MLAAEWIERLGLEPHPEGGFYKRTYCASERFPGDAEADPFPAGRPHSTAIHYLLEAGDFAAFHRIKSDEGWHFHAGGVIEIFIIHSDAGLEIARLGVGEAMQVIVPANTWFAAAVATGTRYGLVSCTVSPGFDFRDHEMASADDLCKSYPNHASLIRRYCRS